MRVCIVVLTLTHSLFYVLSPSTQNLQGSNMSNFDIVCCWVSKIQLMAQDDGLCFCEFSCIFGGKAFVLGCSTMLLCFSNGLYCICPGNCKGVIGVKSCAKECIRSIVASHGTEIIMLNCQKFPPSINKICVEVLNSGSMDCASCLFAGLFDSPVESLIHPCVVRLGPNACVAREDEREDVVSHQIQ